MIRRAVLALGAALASLPFTSPLQADPALPRHDRPGGVSLARRKEAPSPAGEAPALVPLLATLVNIHTGEVVPLADAEPSSDRFSDLCADKGMGARIPMEPRLVDLLRTLARAHPGARIEVVSGYRSAKRNEMMRKKGRHVASHSQHTMGHAVDFRIEGLGVPGMVREIEALRWDGGLGRYDGASDLFVHADVGPNRRWRGK